jgi:hypothetical protein
MEQLIKEGKKEKAEKVIDLAMTSMPIAFYDYYTMLEPFAEGYYALGKTDKARKILDTLTTKYKENLKFLSGMKPSDQEVNAIEIVTNIERYRSLLQVMKKNDLAFYNQNKVAFNSYNKLFERFGRDNE